jgi:hypothetical protein
MKILKKIFDYAQTIIFIAIGGCLIYFIYFGFKTHLWISIFTILFSPLLCYSVKNSTWGVKMFIGFLITVNIFCMGGYYGRYISRIKNVFANGSVERSRDYVPEYEDSEDGHTIEAHYETNYHFKPASDSDVTIAKITEWGFLLLWLGVLVWDYFLLKDALE